MAEINPSLKRIAELLLGETPMAQRDWLPGDHAAALVFRVREELESEQPSDFKGSPEDWRVAQFDAAMAAINHSCWLYASNAKKDLAGAKIIPEKPTATANRYAHLKAAK